VKPEPSTEKGLTNNNKVNEDMLPALFLVLPAPCVMNSRYLNREKLIAIMESLGYNLKQEKVSSKLAYSLWKWNGPVTTKSKKFSKSEVKAGKTRNNFAIVIT